MESPISLLEQLPPEQACQIIERITRIQDLIPLLSVSSTVRGRVWECVRSLSFGPDEVVPIEVIRTFPGLQRLSGRVRIRTISELREVSSRIRGSLTVWNENSPPGFQSGLLDVLYVRSLLYPRSIFNGQTGLYPLRYEPAIRMLTFSVPLEPSGDSDPILRKMIRILNALSIETLQISTWRGRQNRPLPSTVAYAASLKDLLELHSDANTIFRYILFRSSQGLPINLDTIGFLQTISIAELAHRLELEDINPLPSVTRLTGITYQSREETLAVNPIVSRYFPSLKNLDLYLG